MAEGRWVEWLNQSALGFSCHRLSLFYEINTPCLRQALASYGPWATHSLVSSSTGAQQYPHCSLLSAAAFAL